MYEELIKEYEKFPQCDLCGLLVWPDATKKVINYNEGLSHECCIEKAEIIRIKELLFESN